jgi:hypothetical protein
MHQQLGGDGKGSVAAQEIPLVHDAKNPLGDALGLVDGARIQNVL